MAFLRELKVENCSGEPQSVESHLLEVLRYFVAHRPDDPLDFFHSVSEQIRCGEFVPPRRTPLSSLTKASADPVRAKLKFTGIQKELMSVASEDSLVHASNYLKLQGVDSVVVPSSSPDAVADAKAGEEEGEGEGEGEGEEEEEEGEEGEMGETGPLDDLVRSFGMFRDAQTGGGFSPDSVEAHRLVVAMKLLQKRHGFITLRFFGKFFGVKSDYYVVEALIDQTAKDGEEEGEEEEEEGEVGEGVTEEGPSSSADKARKKRLLGSRKEKEPFPPERRGRGSNKYKYYVAVGSLVGNMNLVRAEKELVRKRRNRILQSEIVAAEKKWFRKQARLRKLKRKKQREEEGEGEEEGGGGEVEEAEAEEEEGEGAEEGGEDGNEPKPAADDPVPPIDKVWTELPDVYPKHIIAARSVKKFLVGDLDTVLECHPPFPGVEKHYLRAQIARIAASTVVAPKGVFMLEDDPDVMEEEGEEGEEVEKPIEKIEAYTELPRVLNTLDPDLGTVDLTDLENWVHIYYSVLQTQARCRSLRVMPEEEGEEEEEEGEEIDPAMKVREAMAAELIWPILCPVSKDAAIDSRTPAWSVFRIMPELFDDSYVFLRSLRWPGAVCVGKKTSGSVHFHSVYCGFGLKQTGSTFSPALPLPVCQEEYGRNNLPQYKDPSVEECEEFPEDPEVEEEEGEGEEDDA